MKPEPRKWLIAAMILVAAWAGALYKVNADFAGLGLDENPDQFFGLGPPSLWITAIFLVPSTALFLLIAAGRALFLFTTALVKRR